MDLFPVGVTIPLGEELIREQPLGEERIHERPLGEEPIHERPEAKGHAPWERVGVDVPNPDDPEAQARAEKWRRATQGETDKAEEREEARRKRAEERKVKKEQEEAEMTKKLEKNARLMYIVGFFALPLVWLLSILYFHKEHVSPNANPVIKKCAFASTIHPLSLYSIY